MSAHELFADMTADVLATFGGKQALTYQGANRTVATTGAIFLESDYLGVELQVIEPRWVAAINRADVSSPQRGDRLTDAKDVDWILDERLAQDEWLDIWAIVAK